MFHFLLYVMLIFVCYYKHQICESVEDIHFSGNGEGFGVYDWLTTVLKLRTRRRISLIRFKFLMTGDLYGDSLV